MSNKLLNNILTKKDIAIVTEQLKTIESILLKSGNPAEKSILTKKDLMAYLEVSESHLYRWRKNGKLKYSKHGRKYFYLFEDVRQFIKSGISENK